MSENAKDLNSPQHYPVGSDTTLHNISLEDPANNSLIGKMKSRVSSILPNRFSKWFSPSSIKLQNDTSNGSINTSLTARRRRRIELEDEDEDYEDNDMRRDSGDQDLDRDRDDEDEEENDDEDEESQNSDEEYVVSGIDLKETERDTNVVKQPPAKRSRLNTDVRDSPFITRRQPILSSTPAASGSLYLRNSADTKSVPRPSYQRFTNLNLYANQSIKEPAFNFTQKEHTSAKANTDIIDLISNSQEHEDKHTQSTNIYGETPIISSRKILNIPPSASTLQGTDRISSTVASLKRQPLSAAKADLFTNYESPNCTTPVIQELRDEDEQEQCEVIGFEKSNDTNANTYNGSIETYNTTNITNKKQKLINGNSLASCSNTASDLNEAIIIDSASESGESGNDVIKTNSSSSQRRGGLFNMTVASGSANTRNSSRTSSFGNGLNFYTHLEGQKSLFSGPNNGTTNSLNNSTLSLTSLNRRQFNASIYGSTSALSDSRLLNTFSPFYKGKTTYGGAAAYNKYTAGVGASTVRISPTLIRPTSSLSTLSSSGNSLINHINSHVGDNSTISSTAKRILDLINDFTTPLSEAKKMANILKTNSNNQIPLQAKGRLNENDLNASRAMRLSQVRTPYSRPAVILQPSGNASGRGTLGGLLPPVKELQVPTMSQLLQMKKIQKTTEKARKITQNSAINISTSEYSLPDRATASKTNSSSGVEPANLKHTNKIKSKVSNSLRPSTAPKDIQAEAPPPPVNLPNIAFPLMQSIPKIDIQINKTSCSSSSPQCDSNSLTFASNKETSSSLSKTTTSTTITTINKNSTQTITLKTDNNRMSTNSIQQPTSVKPTTADFIAKSVHTFKFSEPLQIVASVTSSTTQCITKNDIDQYKFSQPLDVAASKLLTDDVARHNTQHKQPQLREGSCLDALNKPLVLPYTPKSNNSNMSTINSGFGDQFKKSPNEWECDVCMIRNKSDANKCVACETPHKQNTIASVTKTSTTSITPSFGLQFKKSSEEWECGTCLVRNKQENKKCIACETVREESSTLLPIIGGDKCENWECPTCMISNKNETNECVACQTKKPGATCSTSSVVTSSLPTSSQFKFGFGNANSSSTAKSSPDEGFKTLAAQQKGSKWECDACMTRNDSSRTKCACCEQLKPGIASAETSNSTLTKFQFGATAAANFSFGFGGGANTTKVDNKVNELSNKNDTPKPVSAAISGTGKIHPSSTQVGFQFGIKPLGYSKKDETDNKNHGGFKFCAISADEANVTEVVAVSQPSFTFGCKPLKATTLTSTTTTMTPTTTISTQATPASSSPAITTSSNTISVSTAIVKFSLPSTTSTNSTLSNDKPTCVAAPTFSFGSNTTTTSTVGGSFGNKGETKPSSVIVEEKKTLNNFAFKAPTPNTSVSSVSTKGAGFVFDSPTATNSILTNTTVSANSSTTTITSSTTTATVKPMFSFISTTSPSSSQTTTATLGGFSFGSNSTLSTTVGSTLFTTVTSTSTAITTSSSNTTSSLSTSLTTSATPATTNIFGTFSGSSNASATPIFGSSINPPTNSNLSTVSSSTSNSTAASNIPQFGSFSTKSTNVFGAFGTSNSSVGERSNNTSTSVISIATTTLPVFGNVAPTSTSQSNSAGFVFGSNQQNSNNNAPLAPTTSTTSSVTSTSTTWPKNSFVFGSATSTSLIANENKEIGTAKPSIFGSFSSPNSVATNQQQTSSIFGASASSNIGSPSSALSTGTSLTSGPTISSTNLFGTNSPLASTTSIFGASSSGKAVTPAPAFGSSPFGGAASSTSATPTFGSTAATTTFGRFGGIASGSSSTTHAAENKKPEAAFNFGSSPATQIASGGFNFGSTSTTKPAFNFGNPATNQQPTFNFTGSSTETQNSTKPFQFGATLPAAPVFNFNPGASEGTPNAPFQFNAGAAPVSSNIFAPTPTPGIQSAQQAKRKVRTQIRRVTQR